MHWTYAQYLEQPIWFTEAILEVRNVEGAYENKQAKKSRN